jgi:hypothetical protein
MKRHVWPWNHECKQLLLLINRRQGSIVNILVWSLVKNNHVLDLDSANYFFIQKKQVAKLSA